MVRIKSFIFCFFLVGCRFIIGEDDRLTLDCNPYLGQSLRIDGYYYLSRLNTEENTNVFFIYNNGVILSMGSFPLKELEKRESIFLNSSFLSKNSRIKFQWGIYQIDSKQSTITYEKWYPSQRPYAAYRKIGKIMNDTTFILTESMRIDGSEKSVIEEIYKFKKFKPKPDSVNTFVCLLE